jgi:hypothetical protein
MSDAERLEKLHELEEPEPVEELDDDDGKLILLYRIILRTLI